MTVTLVNKTQGNKCSFRCQWKDKEAAVTAWWLVAVACHGRRLGIPSESATCCVANRGFGCSCPAGALGTLLRAAAASQEAGAATAAANALVSALSDFFRSKRTRLTRNGLQSCLSRAPGAALAPEPYNLLLKEAGGAARNSFKQVCGGEQTVVCVHVLHAPGWHCFFCAVMPL